MKTALMVIEGVLRKTTGGAPIPEGIRLYQSLMGTGQVVLFSVVESDGPQRAAMEDWLELHGLGNSLVAWGDTGPRVSLANMYRREGYDIDLVVDPDPAVAAALIAAGFNTLLFSHAQYAQPGWRPDSDKGVKPWEAITRQVAEQARLKAQDERLRDTD